MQCCHLDYISQFTTDMRHVWGVDNSVADALSRIEANALTQSLPPAVDFLVMAEAQRMDLELQTLLANQESSSLQITPITLPTGEPTLFCDTSTCIPRPVVPASLCKLAFNSPFLITSWDTCYQTPCHQQKSTEMSTTGQKNPVLIVNVLKLPDIPVPQWWCPPDARFDVVNIDLVGLLPSSHGYQYLLTCVDRFTLWPEVFPLRDITAKSVARAFVFGWIAQFGVPSTIITDRGRQFKSNLWTQLNCLFGIHRQHTTAYHSAANGTVERFHW